MKALRGEITRVLLELARRDDKIFALATDSRGSALLTDFAEELPNQFVECGIAEQDAIGIAAGLANSGLKPFVCGPACFYSMRSAEQIKVDLAYSGMNVKVIGVSGGVSYGALGYTHHATQDIALMRAVAGIDVLVPSDGYCAARLTEALVKTSRPAYVRVGRGPAPDVYEGHEEIVLGRANTLVQGGDAAIIACGEMLAPAVEAARLLRADGICARVLDMHTIKPLDTQAIIAAAQTGRVITVEEHSVHGGLGEAAAGVICQNSPARMRILGLPDETLYTGASADVFAHCGLTPEGIAGAVRGLIC